MLRSMLFTRALPVITPRCLAVEILSFFHSACCSFTILLSARSRERISVIVMALENVHLSSARISSAALRMSVTLGAPPPTPSPVLRCQSHATSVSSPFKSIPKLLSSALKWSTPSSDSASDFGICAGRGAAASTSSLPPVTSLHAPADTRLANPPTAPPTASMAEVRVTCPALSSSRSTLAAILCSTPETSCTWSTTRTERCCRTHCRSNTTMSTEPASTRPPLTEHPAMVPRARICSRTTATASLTMWRGI
mmetsp:Transcript_42372/g.135706  ORF Transcript_42372/g.135706 Transcript_42372/m.135706 type:complete len:253 (+) Transcript_42372:2077-2835(+)